MNKKTIFLGVLIATSIIPQMALASWWNPFSWFDNWNFIRANSENKALERRIQELEQRLDEKSDEQSNLDFSALTVQKEKFEDNSKKTYKPEPKINSETKTQKVEENWNTSLSLTIDKYLEWYVQMRQYLVKKIATIDMRINELNSLSSEIMREKQNGPTSMYQELLGQLLSLNEANINLTNSHKNVLQVSVGGVDYVTSSLNKIKRTLPNMFIDRQTAILYLEDWRGTMDVMSAELDRFEENYEEFKKDVDKQDDFYREARNQLNSILSNELDYILQPTYYPTYQPPKIINCSVSSYGNEGTINCVSY